MTVLPGQVGVDGDPAGGGRDEQGAAPVAGAQGRTQRSEFTGRELLLRQNLVDEPPARGQIGALMKRVRSAALDRGTPGTRVLTSSQHSEEST